MYSNSLRMYARCVYSVPCCAICLEFKRILLMLARIEGDTIQVESATTRQVAGMREAVGLSKATRLFSV